MHDYLYMPCQVNDASGVPMNLWHFCCITKSKLGQQLVYPVGYCRKNKCTRHTTPQKACDCFWKYEIEIDTRYFTGLDFNAPNGQVVKGRNQTFPCAMCKKPCTGYVQVGMNNTEYQLCDKHRKPAIIKKIHPPILAKING